MRMRPYTKTIPKPMIACNGKPFLEYLLKQLAAQGYNCFLLLTGYLGEQIQEYFHDGSQWGWKIKYSHGPVEWDTGRRIWESRSQLEEKFLLFYSDNIVPFPLKKILHRHTKSELPLTFLVTPKNPGNLALTDEGLVKIYSCESSMELSYVELGYMVVARDLIFSYFLQPDCSFSEILERLSTQQQISACIHKDPYHSISDPERWKKTEEYLRKNASHITRRSLGGEYSDDEYRL